jgi:hypothetical protein
MQSFRNRFRDKFVIQAASQNDAIQISFIAPLGGGRTDAVVEENA